MFNVFPLDSFFFCVVCVSEKSFGYKKGLLFSEGWVEFKNKRDAKRVALALNNTSVGGKKRNPWYTCIWNIKYLPKFSWTDVNADKELKRATHENRIRTEISQAKKQTNFYSGNVEFSKNLDRMKKKKIEKGEQFEGKTFLVTQRKTDEEILAEKRTRKREFHDDDSEEKKSKKKKSTFGDNDETKSREFVMKNIFGSVL